MQILNVEQQTAEMVLNVLLENSGVEVGNNYYTSNEDDVEDAVAGAVLVTKHNGKIEQVFRVTVTKEMHFDSCCELPVE